MTTHIGIGFSQEHNTTNAAREAAIQAKAQTKQQIIHMAIVFSTVHYGPLETLRAIRQTLVGAKILGCSTAGIILSQTIEMRGIAVLAFSSQDIKFGIGSVGDLTSINMRIAGSELAKKTLVDFGQNRRGIFLLIADGLLTDISLILKGVQERLGKVFPIVGAGSSDNFYFKETHQFFQDKVLRNSVTAVLFGGDLRMGLGNRHGFKPLGKPRYITKAEGNTIKTIDNKRASGLYEEYLGLSLGELQSNQFTKTIILYPLGIHLREEKEYLLRTATNILNDGSIVCQGDVPEGSEVHLMIGNKDFCKQAVVDATQEVRDALSGVPPKLVIVFESLSRYRLLGRNAFEEIEVIREILGPAIPIIGMYSYGEIAPLKSFHLMGEAYLQNGTIVILAMA